MRQQATRRATQDTLRRPQGRRGVIPLLPAILTILLASLKSFCPVSASAPATGQLRKAATTNNDVSQQHQIKEHRRADEVELHGLDDFSDLLDEDDTNEEDPTFSSDSFGADVDSNANGEEEENVEESTGMVNTSEEDFDAVVMLDAANGEEDVGNEAEELFNLLQEQLQEQFGHEAVPDTNNITTEAPTMTFQPTFQPTAEPTNQPSIVPSVSSAPTQHPTEQPSTVPSSSSPPTFTAAPSQYPTSQPSIVPSISSAPTLTHSSAPSVSHGPTSEPTASPTPAPSSSPTKSPTPAPTPAPTTAAPTSSPTPACHDQRGYKSPINGLGCEQHIGSNCENWRHIGLNEYQVVELHRACPVACGTDCE